MFRYVRAAFFVPCADCQAAPGAATSHWVGLDRLGSNSVEQIGVAVHCAGSKPHYYAWYEMYLKGVRSFSRCIQEMPLWPVCVTSRLAGNSVPIGSAGAEPRCAGDAQRTA